MFSNLFSSHRKLRQDILPFTEKEKEQYRDIYDEFKHHSEYFFDEIFTYSLKKNIPFDLDSWKNFLDKNITINDSKLSDMGEFKVTKFGKVKVLIFSPKITGGRLRKKSKGKLSKRKSRSKRKTKKSARFACLQTFGLQRKKSKH